GGGLAALWLGPFYFLSQKVITLLFAYQEGLGLSQGPERVQFPFVNFVEHIYAYFSQSVYVFTPLVFWFAVFGLAKIARREGPEGDAFRKILFPVFLILLLSRLTPVTYMDRHMLPFLPLLLLAAGYQLETFFGSLHGKAGPVRLLFFRN